MHKNDLAVVHKNIVRKMKKKTPYMINNQRQLTDS